MRLHELEFDCDVLNSMMIQSTLRVLSCVVSELEATVSWSSLNDGCKIILRGVRIVVGHSSSEGAEIKKERGKRSRRPSTGHRDFAESQPSGSDCNPEDSTVEEESAGVTFLANWIDVVIARVQLVIEDINVVISSEYGQKAARPAFVRLGIEKVEFFNSNPSDIRDSGGSVVAAAQSMSRGMHRSSAKSSVLDRDRSRRSVAASVAALSTQAGRDAKVNICCINCFMYKMSYVIRNVYSVVEFLWRFGRLDMRSDADSRM